MLAMVSTKNTYANEEKISAFILQSFNNSFDNAKNVTWSKVKDLYKAEFVLNDQTLSVWYSPEGDLIALSRKMNPEQLPLSLQTSLQKRAEGYTITELFEIDNDAGTSYYAALENNSKKIILESISVGGWSIYQKSKK